MKINKNEKDCKIVNFKSFLWFRWPEIVDNHDWEYYDQDNRYCTKCKRQEKRIWNKGEYDYYDHWVKAIRSRKFIDRYL